MSNIIKVEPFQVTTDLIQIRHPNLNGYLTRIEARVLRDTLNETLDDQHPGFKIAIQVVCQHFRISELELLGRSRHHKFVWPRQIAMALCAEMFNQTTKEVAVAFKRHQTLVNNARRELVEYQKSSAARAEIDKIRRAVKDALAV